MGFFSVLNTTKAGFDNNSDLQDFCQQNWNKNLTVKISYRRRTEINMDELPILLITRPSIDRTNHGRIGTGKHTVRLYFGFYQPDIDKIAQEAVDFEETVEAAIWQNVPLRQAVEEIVSRAAVNDEGKFAPTCFSVKEIDVTYTPPEPDEGNTVMPTTVFAGRDPDIGAGNESSYEEVAT